MFVKKGEQKITDFSLELQEKPVILDGRDVMLQNLSQRLAPVRTSIS